MNKETLRREMLEKRKKLSKTFIFGASLKIAEKFLNTVQNAQKILMYLDINNEVKTKELALQLQNSGKEIYLPAVRGVELVTGPMRKGLQPGPYCTEEPVVIDDTEEFDVAVIPAVAFDKELYRLGYGGGYYDRLLPKLKIKLKTGFGYGFQVVSTVYPEIHDVQLDMLITEHDIYRRSCL
jgi:5-formyltetrahydrofolate cyclo-ligase